MGYAVMLSSVALLLGPPGIWDVLQWVLLVCSTRLHRPTAFNIVPSRLDQRQPDPLEYDQAGRKHQTDDRTSEVGENVCLSGLCC